jgi:Polysaccharide deacetylase
VAEPSEREAHGHVRAKRHPAYLAARLRAIVQRYGLTSQWAKERARRCLRTLEPYGLQPTFATPGAVVESDPAFFQELSDAGAEVAIHGYDHADFRRLSSSQARWQFEKAIEAYERSGIPFEGFRCPYLSYTPEVRAVLPDGAFAYSSNTAIARQVVRLDAEDPIFTQLARNYRAAPSDDVVCAPSFDGPLVELPASVPDDLQLCDGLGLGNDGLRRAWTAMLEEAHSRGELFAPLFHPEAYDLLDAAMDGLLQAAHALRPSVWLTQLRDVARWWRERETFRARWVSREDGLSIEFDCGERATVLARGWRWTGNPREWDGGWSVIDERRVHIDDGTRPFVGLTGVDPGTVAFLKEQGYVVDDGEHPERCSVCLSGREVEELGSRRALVEHIERSKTPLLRYSPWPAESKSALCIAGDLDALSLRSYARRLHPAVRARQSG